MREREHREESDQLWKTIRDDLPAMIANAVRESEARVVSRIDRMDTRINGRVKKVETDIAGVGKEQATMKFDISKLAFYISAIAISVGGRTML